MKKALQFIKFSMVGVSNTLVFYAVYWLILKAGLHYLLCNVIAFSVSVLNAHYWNRRYVFHASAASGSWLASFVRTYLSYAGTGIVLGNLLLIFWVEYAGISRALAPLLNLFLTTPVNFLLNKYWAYGKDA